MISSDIMREMETVLRAIFCGMFLPFVYDILVILRKVISHKIFWVIVEDFFYWIWTSLWIFSVLYRENDGSFRGYTIFAMVLGMVLYKKCLKICGKKLKKFLKRSIIFGRQDRR